MRAAADHPQANVSEADVRREVQRFYDSVGWKRVGPDLFQNARYEDLRPVSQEYIQRCRRRVLRHLQPRGRYLLDAGSGPIQYPEYLEYSAGFTHRVCLDLSALALHEARERIGGHGLYVVADIAHLPLQSSALDGAVSLHTIHHLPEVGQRQAFDELARVLRPGTTAVVVYGWSSRTTIETWTRVPMRMAQTVVRAYRRRRGLPTHRRPRRRSGEADGERTHVFKHGHAWLRENTRHLPSVDILVWRSVSTQFLRSFIHERLLGRFWLRCLYWLEEQAPHWFGRHGQYPLIVLRKPPDSLEIRSEV
jgi:SAM-dependent methyltransferase